MSSLEVATASFASTPASGSLIATHKLNAERPEYRSFANIVYRKKTSIQFIGAVASDSNTAVMPSHQVLDCIVVFAINTTGQTAPLVPANEGWTTLVSQDGTMGVTVAYKFALTNTETVGGWVFSDRTAVGVYRNVRDIDGFRISHFNNKPNIRFGTLIQLQVQQGSRLVGVNVSRDVVDNDNVVSGNLRASLHQNDPNQTGPGLVLADKLYNFNATSDKAPSNKSIWNIVSHGEQVGVLINLRSGKPTIYQETSSRTRRLLTEQQLLEPSLSPARGLRRTSPSSCSFTNSSSTLTPVTSVTQLAHQLSARASTFTPSQLRTHSPVKTSPRSEHSATAGLVSQSPRTSLRAAPQTLSLAFSSILRTARLLRHTAL